MLSPKKVLYYSAVTVLTLMNSAALASLFSGQAIKDMYAGQANWRRFVVFYSGIVVVQLLVLAVIPRPAGRLALKEGSTKFAKFFSGWYRGSGHIRIYCTDIEWLEGEVNAPILEEVKKKAAAGRVEIFLRNYRGTAVRELLEANAMIYVIPETVRLRTRMSMRDDDGSMHLIIRLGRTRDGGADGAKVALVRATTDRYWCDLAKETMDACRTGQPLQLAPGGGSVVVLS